MFDESEVRVELLRIARKSLDILLNKLLGSPFDREIDFYVDLMPDVGLTLCHRIGLFQQNWKSLGIN